MRKNPISIKCLLPVLILLLFLAFLPQFTSRFYIYMTALIMVTGLLATSLNMVLGFGGMYQFHHAVFYGVGAYAAAIVLTKTQFGPWIAFVAAPVAAAILGLAMGAICVRLTKLYFGMLQISLGSLVWAIVFRWYSFTGGDDGIHGVSLPDAISSTSGAYYFTLAVTAASMGLMFLIVNSSFGKIFQTIRDNPERSEAIGIDVKRHQLIGLTIAAFFAGVAGFLFVVVEGSVFPELMFWTLSLEILIMCLLGGWFVFFGPMLGAAAILLLRTFVGAQTEYWTTVMGVILMLLIFFLPEGILGFLLDRFGKKSGKRVAGDM